jgi:tetratricopeptide (TPR) repeat protein
MQKNVDSIIEDACRQISIEPVKQSSYPSALALHLFLWESKPERYNGEFLLTKVIDSQLDYNPEKAVGNCVGLTSLYTVLGQRLGLDISVIEFPDHISCVLHDSPLAHIIETTDFDGFDLTKGKDSTILSLDNKEARCLPAEALVPCVLNSRGTVKSKMKDYAGAIADYNKAIELNPGEADSYINRGDAKFKLKDYIGAIADYGIAIKIDPADATVYSDRGIAYFRNKEYACAIADFKAALKIDPTDKGARAGLSLCENPFYRFFNFVSNTIYDLRHAK